MVNSALNFYTPSNYINGGTVGWLSNTTVSISACTCLDSTNSFLIKCPSATVNTALTGINGVDIGSITASSVYYVYAISATDNKSTPGYIISLSSSAPTLPLSYDIYRLIGVQVVDASSHLLKMIQSGINNDRQFTFDTLQALTVGTDVAFTAISGATLLPSIDNLRVKLQASFTPATAANSFSWRKTGSSSSAGNSSNAVVVSVAQLSQIDSLFGLSSGAPKIDYKLTSASDVLTLNVVSFNVSL